jgi:predicted dehydrogenase
VAAGSSTALRYAIVGTGMMGVEHIQALQTLPDTHIVALCDPHAPSLSAARHALDADRDAARVYTDVETMVAAGEFDVAVLASPNHTHRALAELLLRSGAHLLIEKPLCTTAQDCTELISLERETQRPGRVVWVGLEYRYMAPTMQLLAHARSGVLGSLRMLAIREHRFPFLVKVQDWNRFSANTGGTLVEKCCHFFDLMRHLTQSEPVRVYASAGVDHNHLDETYTDGTPDILDNAYVIVDFASGQRAMLELCMFAEGARYQEEISVVGPQGKAECFVPGPGRFWPEPLGDAPVPKLVISPREPKGPREVDVPVDPLALAAGDHNGSTLYQHQKFNAVVRGQGTVEVSLRDGLSAVIMGLAAQESARTGQAIDLLQGPYALAEVLGAARR